MGEMDFNFNPTLWFICRLCRHSFADTKALNEHKLACHLGECMGIKCIVFEERLLKEEWMPEHNISENPYTTLNETLKESSKTGSSFKNPSVLLTRSTEQEMNSSSNRSSSSHECQGGKIQESSENGIHSDKEVMFKMEFPVYDESTLENTVGNEEDYTDTDLELVVASVSSNCDGVPQVGFESTLISTSPREYQLYRTNADFNTTVTTAELEHPETMSNNETNDLNSSSIIILNKIKTDVTDVNPTELENDLQHEISAIQQPEQQIRKSNQRQSSTSLPNRRSRTVVGKTVKKPLMCENCFACFRTKHELKKHEVLCHSSIKPFKCSQCAYKFKFKGHLERHQVVHGKVSKFKCRFCNKYFGENSHLIDHERIHTGERPFNCKVAYCSYAASCKSTLTKHIRSRHC